MDKEDVTHIYNGILLSHKKNYIELFVMRWMDLESVIQSEVKSEREKQIPYANTYIWNLEKNKNGGFPGGTVVKNLPTNAGDTCSSPGPGRSHMPQSN